MKFIATGVLLTFLASYYYSDNETIRYILKIVPQSLFSSSNCESLIISKRRAVRSISVEKKANSPSCQRRHLEIPLTEQLVYTDSQSGNLVYNYYANHVNNATSSVANGQALNKIPDFSHAGYKGGGVSIPFVETRIRVSPVNGDASASVQAAIDEVSAMPLNNSTGFRGAVLIEAGNYKLSTPISVTTTGVVIRGQGSNDSGGTIIHFTTSDRDIDAFTFGRAEGRFTTTQFPVARVLDEFVPVGSTSLSLNSTENFLFGDKIIIELTPNDAWIDHLSAMSQYGWTSESFGLVWRREIVGVSGKSITLNAPVVQAIEALYGGAIVFKYTLEQEIGNVGIENMQIVADFVSETDENHARSAVVFQRVTDGWVRQVTAKHFWYGAINIKSFSKYVTIEDSAMLEYKGMLSQSTRYSFNVDDSDFVLFQRCLASDGRHDFVSGSRTPGPNVWVDSTAINANSDSGPHHRYATGQLYDNINVREVETFGKLFVRNRGSSGSGHGWSGAQVLFWNTNATIIADAPNGAMNYAVGNTGPLFPTDLDVAEPNGLIQSLNERVNPRSLYYSQLKDRMGSLAVNTQLIPVQKQGTIWNLLESWYGDGLFLDPVVAWVDEDFVPIVPLQIVAIGGKVRDLNLLESSLAYEWRLLTGPGPAQFVGSSRELESAVRFEIGGDYTIELVATSATDTKTATVTISVSCASSWKFCICVPCFLMTTVLCVWEVLQ